MTTDQYKIATMSLVKSFLKSVWSLGTPKNISYFWGFGSFLGMVMVIQVFSGVMLAFYYVSGSQAWTSVIELTREVSSGWLIRSIHSNTASFVFIVLFVHFFRGILQSSFTLKGPWMSGWLIMVLTMAAAFLGYVLPWGQMSFWGATVIINLLSILPMGKTIVIWLWGGFYVSSFTCSFFYTLHFLVPLLVLALAGIHLILLHSSGSSTPGGTSRSNILKTKFSHYFLFKDLVNLSLIWAMWLVILAQPDWAADPVNFVVSDLSNSPIHIQPEWYFLHLYAILRSIPNKLGGLVGFFLAIILLLILAKTNFFQSLNQFSLYNLLAWTFIWTNLILMWLGMQPVEDPFIEMGQVSTCSYFLYMYMVLKWNKMFWKYF